MFPSIFVAYTKINYGYSFAALLKKREKMFTIDRLTAHKFIASVLSYLRGSFGLITLGKH